MFTLRKQNYYLYLIFLLLLAGASYLVIECISNERANFYKNLQIVLDPKASKEERTNWWKRLEYRAQCDSVFFREEKTVNMLLDALTYPDIEIRRRAVQIMGLTKSIIVFDALKKVVKYDSSENVRAVAAVSLGDIGCGNPFPILRELLIASDQPAGIRACAACGIGAIGSKKGNDFLQIHFEKEGNKDVRTSIIHGLWFHPETSGNELIPFLIKTLNDPAERARRTGYFVLTKITKKDFGWRSDATLEMREKACKKIRSWWKDNKDYLCWSEKGKYFMIDEKAKKTGIPTEEYRKSHPWPKEDKPNEPK